MSFELGEFENCFLKKVYLKMFEPCEFENCFFKKVYLKMLEPCEWTSNESSETFADGLAATLRTFGVQAARVAGARVLSKKVCFCKLRCT